MKITDSLTLDASGLTTTRDGYLIGEAKVARAGNVQKYTGAELGLTDERAGEIFGVYRDPEAVFDEDSMLSLAGRPVTRGHPPYGVDAENWRELTVGQMGGRVKRDGEHVVAPMAIMDAKAAKEVADGARSLSAGYVATLVADEGIAEDGTRYQFRQAGPIRFNHVAYLPDNNPRAGNTRVRDGAASWGPAAPINPADRKEPEMPDNLRTVVVDGLSVSTTDQGAQAIEKLTKDRDDARKALSDAEAAHKTAIDAKDAEIAKKEAENDDLKKKVVDDAALDALVQKRADLIAKAKTVAKDVKTDGVSDAEIRKATVVAALGDDAVKDKSAAYVDARFDILVEEAGKKSGATDPLRNLGDGVRANDGGGAGWNDALFAKAGVQTKKQEA